MAMQTTGAPALTQMLAGQAERFLAHAPALDAARADLEAVRRQHPEWNRPTSWYVRTAVRVEHFIANGRLL